MLYTRDLLQTKGIEELRAISVSVGIVPHHASKEPKIIEGILSTQHAIDPSERHTKPEEPRMEDNVVQVYNNTPEEVQDAVREAVGNKQGFKMRFDETSWTFEYRGRMDSGTLKQSMKRIIKCAQQVAKGGYAPAKTKVNGETVLAS